MIKKLHIILALALSITTIISIYYIITYAQTKPIQTFIIPQNGMYPTLPKGSMLLCDKFGLSSIKDINHGDILTFKMKEPNDKYEYVYIWRAIALPNDQLEITNNYIKLNGQTIKRTKTYSNEKVTHYNEYNHGSKYLISIDKNQSREMNHNITIPDNHIFFMGDNRNNARDSRFHGTIPFEKIICRYRFKIN